MTRKNREKVLTRMFNNTYEIFGSSNKHKKRSSDIAEGLHNKCVRYGDKYIYTNSVTLYVLGDVYLKSDVLLSHKVIKILIELKRRKYNEIKIDIELLDIQILNNEKLFTVNIKGNKYYTKLVLNAMYLKEVLSLMETDKIKVYYLSNLTPIKVENCKTGEYAFLCPCRPD